MIKKKVLTILLTMIIGNVSFSHIIYPQLFRERFVNNITYESIKKIEIYGVPWEADYNTPTTIKNLRKRSVYCMTINNSYHPFPDELFDDYKSCDEYLTSQDTIHSRIDYCEACVIIYFKFRTIKIYFRENAYYCYKGIWYKPNYELFYYIFNIFGIDSLIPNNVIEKGKKKI